MSHPSQKYYLTIISSFQASVEELKTLLSRYGSTDELAMNGVKVGGTKYMYISSTDRVVRAKKGTSGLHCIKTVQGKNLCYNLRLRSQKLSISRPVSQCESCAR